MNKIEEGALAIWKANGWHPPNAEDYKTAPWALCKRQARAVIEAMREPTKAMRLAGDNEYEEERESIMGPAPVPMWRAMIDKALEE